MNLTRLPRRRYTPYRTPIAPRSHPYGTPIEPLINLSRALGGAQLFIKRYDGALGLAGGGNQPLFAG